MIIIIKTPYSTVLMICMIFNSERVNPACSIPLLYGKYWCVTMKI